VPAQQWTEQYTRTPPCCVAGRESINTDVLSLCTTDVASDPLPYTVGGGLTVIKTGPHLYLILLNVVFDGQDTEIEDVKVENQIFYKKCGILILDVLMTRL
jgi:hypothetical protein